MPLITREPEKERRVLLTAAAVVAYLVLLAVVLTVMEVAGAPYGLMQILAGGASLSGPGVIWAAWRYFGRRG